MTAPGSYREGGEGVPEASSSAGAVSHGRIATQASPPASPHTPGEWSPNGLTGEITVLRGNRLIPMFVIAPECDGEVMPFEEAIANLHLAAAAPELLEALQWALTAADRLADITPAGLLRTGIRAKADECRAAIAKATGGDQ